jgi:CP family cyanate transporter-like MFS transporter
MDATSQAQRQTAASNALLCLALLWLAGNGMRITILAVPPVISTIHDDLGMTATQVGILSGLPMVLFAAAAVPGSLLIARFGALSALIFGLLATALGSALRGASESLSWLYAASILTGFGVAVIQPAMPPLVRAWAPHRIGFATAVYTNGLLIGEIIPIALTIPVVLPMVAGSWRASFVVWAIPVAIIAIVIALLAPRPAATISTVRKWWPNWRDGLIWRLGLILGSANAMYFASNAFIPDYLHHSGRDAEITGALTALNIGQLPASFLLLLFAGRLELKAWPYMAHGILGLASIFGIVFGDALVLVIATTTLGFVCAATLILILALPPLLSAPDDVHRTAAAMFTISYSCAVITPVFSGLAWDMAGVPAAAFIPIALCALLPIVLAPKIARARAQTGIGAG